VCADLLSYAELVLWLCALKEDNKEDEELVDVAPCWGEPHISFVMVLCSILFMWLCIYFLSAYSG
jgi:hypothetical protein